MNIAAFRWGRRAAHDPQSVRALVDGGGERKAEAPPDLDTVIEQRAAFLTRYANRSYGERYRSRVASARAAEEKARPGSTAFADAVARNLFRLMAIKDEYEVARLFTGAEFERGLRDQFETWDHLEYHMAPPIMARRDAGGALRKSAFGPWFRRALGVVAALRPIRGTAVDPFAYTAERRKERRWLSTYEADVDALIRDMSPERLDLSTEFAGIPSVIRGYGHVKEEGFAKAEQARKLVLDRVARQSKAIQLAAAE
jgi:indolepyruvate ferredoxin oxidoreductase